MKGHWWTHMSLSIIFYQPETKGFRSCDRKLSPPTDSKSLWLPALLESESCSVVSDSLQPPYSPWNSPGQNTGVGSRSLLQGIFPTQGLNPGLPHCRQILYQLSHQGSPRILEWVAYPFSRGCSWPRNLTGVSYIAADSELLTLMNSVPVPFLPVDWWWRQPTEQKVWSNNWLTGSSLPFPVLPFHLFLFSLLIAHFWHYHWEVVDRHYSSSKKE